MPASRYEAMTSSGEEVVDVIEANDSKTARKLLAARGLLITKLSETVPESAEGSESDPSASVVRASTRPTRQLRQPTGSVLLPCLIIGLAGIASGTYGVSGLSMSTHLLVTGERADGIVTRLTPAKDSSGSPVRGLEFPTVSIQSPGGPV